MRFEALADSLFWHWLTVFASSNSTLNHRTDGNPTMTQLVNCLLTVNERAAQPCYGVREISSDLLRWAGRTAVGGPYFYLHLQEASN